MNDPRIAEYLQPVPNAQGDICFQCGNPVPSSFHLLAPHHGRLRPVCCYGCQAVATSLRDHQSTLEDLIASQAYTPVSDELRAYDEPSFVEQHARTLPTGDMEMMLILEGLRCAACVWVNEEVVRRLPGVRAFHINRVTERAELQFDPQSTPLSKVLQAIEALGYRAWPFDRARAYRLEQDQQQQSLRQVFVAGLMMMQVMMFASPWYFAAPGEVEPVWEHLLRWASLVLTVPVMLYCAYPISVGAWRSLRQRRLSMDVPIGLALWAAFLASIWATCTQQGAVYYDSITMFVFLLLGARHLEMLARRRAMQSLSRAWRAVPRQITRLTAQGESTVSLNALALGDRIRLNPGTALPIDARLLSAQGEWDMSLLSGESLPVVKQRGDEIPAGAVNISQPLELQVLRLEKDSFVSSMERLIDRASRERPALQQAADRVAAWFLLGLLLLTLLVGMAWWWIDASRALPIAIAVLVVSCPCALSLATPTALAAATVALAQRGVLVTRANALEKLARLTDVAFDKTGTLTQPHPRLTDITVLSPHSRTSLLSIVAALEAHSQHPLASALRAAAQQEPVPMMQATDVQIAPGQGLQGKVNGVTYRLGNTKYCAADAIDSDKADTMQVFLADNTGVLAVFHFHTPLRAHTAMMLDKLQAAGLQLHLLSGDSMSQVQALARDLPFADVQGGLLPEQKVQAVRTWQQAGRVVAMVGDGVNDAPVLAGADVSMAMSEGADLAQASADAVLLSGLDAIPSAVLRARATLRVMKQNLAWAAAYNLCAIPAAALGYVSPLLAAIGMSTSSLFVVLNAMRLLKKA